MWTLCTFIFAETFNIRKVFRADYHSCNAWLKGSMDSKSGGCSLTLGDSLLFYPQPTWMWLKVGNLVHFSPISASQFNLTWKHWKKMSCQLPTTYLLYFIMNLNFTLIIFSSNLFKFPIPACSACDVFGAVFAHSWLLGYGQGSSSTHMDFI